MKNFIINLGNGLIDFCAWALLLSLIVVTIITMKTESFWAGMGVLFGGLILLIAIFYFIYLLISINDNLQSINNKLGQGQNNREEQP